MKTETVTRPLWTQVALVALLMIASFMVGSLYTKVRYLEAGGAPAAGQAVKSKYKTFDDAMAAFGKAAKLDTKKLLACMNSGEKKAIVEADTAEGGNLGITGTPGFIINGRLLGGAFPYEAFKEVIDKELEGKGSDKASDYSQNLQDANKSGAFDPKPRSVEIGNANIRGNAGAVVKIIEYSDFQCPFCSRVHPTVKKILSEYGDKVVLVYKHFPLVSIHPRAQISAEAAECAKDQGKFWEFHDQLFEHQTDWSSL